MRSLDQIKRALVEALKSWGYLEALDGKRSQKDPMFTKLKKRGSQAPVNEIDITQISNEELWSRLSEELVSPKDQGITEMYYIRFKGKHPQRVARKFKVSQEQVVLISASAIETVAMAIQELEIRDYLARQGEGSV